MAAWIESDLKDLEADTPAIGDGGSSKGFDLLKSPEKLILIGKTDHFFTDHLDEDNKFINGIFFSN